MTEIELHDLADALWKSWDKDTAWKNKGALGEPEGQCFVTALIVQDFFGGKILRQDFGDGDIHFWNRLSDGREIDLTSAQFPSGDGLNPAQGLKGELYKRKVTLYERLRGRVLQYLEDAS